MVVRWVPAKGEDIPSKAEQKVKKESTSRPVDLKPGHYWDPELGMQLPDAKVGDAIVYVDDWISTTTRSKDEGEAYAKFFLHHQRLPAIMQYMFQPFVEQYELYCDFAGRTWRVTGASKLGDIWLQPDFTKDAGYKLRRYVNECSNWRPHP